VGRGAWTALIITSREMDVSVGRLAARAVIGGLFIGHGTQKLFGWFGGPGRAGTEGMMDSLQMRPAKVHALAAGLTETVGGGLLVTGLATPVAAAALTGVMTTAIKKVHLPNGPWAANGGWEYNAVLIAAVVALTETGPGDLSLDHALGTERSGPAWALGALATGVSAAALAMWAGSRGASPTAVASDDTAAQAAHEDTAGDPSTTGADASSDVIS
jgi:putative oxidoreductase